MASAISSKSPEANFSLSQCSVRFLSKSVNNEQDARAPFTFENKFQQRQGPVKAQKKEKMGMKSLSTFKVTRCTRLGCPYIRLLRTCAILYCHAIAPISYFLYSVLQTQSAHFARD